MKWSQSAMFGDAATLLSVAAICNLKWTLAQWNDDARRMEVVFLLSEWREGHCGPLLIKIPSRKKRFFMEFFDWTGTRPCKCGGTWPLWPPSCWAGADAVCRPPGPLPGNRCHRMRRTHPQLRPTLSRQTTPICWWNRLIAGTPRGPTPSWPKIRSRIRWIPESISRSPTKSVRITSFSEKSVTFSFIFMRISFDPVKINRFNSNTHQLIACATLFNFGFKSNTIGRRHWP